MTISLVFLVLSCRQFESQVLNFCLIDLVVIFCYQYLIISVFEEMVLADRAVNWPAVTCVH